MLSIVLKETMSTTDFLLCGLISFWGEKSPAGVTAGVWFHFPSQKRVENEAYETLHKFFSGF